MESQGQEGPTKLALTPPSLPRQSTTAWGMSTATAGVGFISPTLEPSEILYPVGSQLAGACHISSKKGVCSLGICIQTSWHGVFLQVMKNLPHNQGR